jgi:hypothetical protein
MPAVSAFKIRQKKKKKVLDKFKKSAIICEVSAR